MNVLLENGANMEAVSNLRTTPLIEAAKIGHSSCVSLLLKAGAQIDNKGKTEKAPMQWAQDNGEEEVIKILLEYTK